MSIRGRLLLLVALATLVPGILVGIRFLENRAREIEAATGRLAEIAAAIADNLDEKIQGTAQLHAGLGRAYDLATGDRAACSAFLSDVLDQYPLYTGLLTINPDGRLFCDSLKTGRELVLTDRKYFIEAMEKPDGVTLQPAFGRLTGRSVLQIAHPVRGPDGRLSFVLLASLDLNKFVQDHQRRYAGRDIALIEKSGEVLVWSSEAQPSARSGTSIVGTELFALMSAPSALPVGEITGPDGTPQVWTASSGTHAYDPGLVVLVGSARADLISGANRRLFQDVVVLVVVSLLLFGSVWAVGELAIHKQVGRITSMAVRLGHGDLSARVAPPYPRGELGELMTVLNGAAQSLEQQSDAITELHKRLQQSQRMDAIGQLTGGVAHDFNNLLMVILGNAEQLSDSLAREPELKTLAEMTMRAAERGAELSNRLLAFSRRQALDPRPTDVNRRLSDMAQLLRRTLGEHVEIEIAGAPELWPAMVDPGQLENAVLNLCLNARDAMPGGGPLRIETANVMLDEADARAQSEVEPGPYVSIAVIDDGEGMAPATVERAFEPFFTTKPVGKGSGLGLSMVYGFVKQSGGHARIQSEVGTGTMVRLYLPRAETAAVVTQDGPRPAAAEGHERILLVEDDELVLDHVSNELRRLGYRVTVARNGRDALEILRQNEPFDLLFTDVVMPGGVSGTELADQAAALRPNLPVLLTSGYVDNGADNPGRPSRALHLLQKPYRRQELAVKLRSILDRPKEA